MAAAIGDFVIRRADGIPAYQLAVVVDDAAMGITDVVRGDDLLGSTARQLLLYRALGLPAPRFAHVPLMLGPDGARLSKRHGAIGVRALAERGLSPARVVGLLAATLGLCPAGAEAPAARPRRRLRARPDHARRDDDRSRRALASYSRACDTLARQRHPDRRAAS